MTTDLHDLLERARKAAPPVDLDLSSVERRRDRKAARRRIGGLAVGLGLSVVIASVVLTLPDEQDDGRGDAPAADPSLAVGEGYWYREEVFFFTTDPGGNPDRACILRFQGARWVGADWSAETLGGRLQKIDGTGQVTNDCNHGPQGWGPGPGEFEDASFEPGEYPHGDPPMADLPTDPADLAAVLIRSAAPDGSSPQPAVTPGPGQAPETGALVRVLEQSALEAPPALQPGFYWFGRRIPGMEVDESATDPTGREAVALHIETEGADRTWYFEPAHFQVLAYVATEADSGELHEMRVVMGGGIVREPGEVPSGNGALVPEPLRAPQVGGISYDAGRTSR